MGAYSGTNTLESQPRYIPPAGPSKHGNTQLFDNSLRRSNSSPSSSRLPSIAPLRTPCLNQPCIPSASASEPCQSPDSDRTDPRSRPRGLVIPDAMTQPSPVPSPAARSSPLSQQVSITKIVVVAISCTTRWRWARWGGNCRLGPISTPRSPEVRSPEARSRAIDVASPATQPPRGIRADKSLISRLPVCAWPPGQTGDGEGSALQVTVC